MSKKTKRINILIEIIMWLLSIVVIYPLLMVVITSFKPKGEASYLNINFPTAWAFDNYAEVWEQGHIPRAFFNSMFITVLSVLLVLVLASVFSYVLVRRNTKIGRAHV